MISMVLEWGRLRKVTLRSIGLSSRGDHNPIIANAVIVQCPAKINETLLVGEPDSRGYHPIETVFQAVGLFDTLRLTPASENSFTCDIELPADNTVTKAWKLLGELITIPPLAVSLEKRIPAQSGLGGGSSDAAGFLSGVEAVIGRRVSEGPMADIAFAVGADVPFFLLGGRAEGRGYGEVLRALPDEAARWLVIAMPSVTCSTKEMYAALDAVGRPRKVENDFELVAPRESLDLIERLRDLGSVQAGLSGSGSACFGYFGSQNEADIAASQLPGMWRRVVRTIGRDGN